MMGGQIPAELSVLCKILSPWTTERDIKILTNVVGRREVDWERVAFIANHAYLAQALWPALQDKGLTEGVPPLLLEYLDEIHRFNSVRNEALRLQLIEVAGLLNNIGITPMLLKGSISLATDIFPDPAARFMWDLDLLIPDGEMERAVAALKERGYFVPEECMNGPLGPINYSYSKHHAPLFRSGEPAAVELHRRLLDGYGSLLEARTVWRESGKLTSSRLPGVSLALMSPAHQVIHCFAHSELAHENHRFRRLDLRQLHHFAHLCRRFRDEVEWERLAALMEEGCTGQVLGAYLYLAQRLFGVEIPVSSPPDAYARRHLSMVLFFLDGKWKRLRLSWDLIGNLLHSFMEEGLRSRYPAEEDLSANRLRLRLLKAVFRGYLWSGAWKKMVDARGRKFNGAMR